jgi:RNA polymerase sigma-70 factor (ECF subfamily)
LAEAFTFKANYQTIGMVIKEAVVAPFRTDSGEMSFEQVFKSHFKNLHAYACTILGEEVMAEEMVQNVFLQVMGKAGSLKYS